MSPDSSQLPPARQVLEKIVHHVKVCHRETFSRARRNPHHCRPVRDRSLAHSPQVLKRTSEFGPFVLWSPITIVLSH